MCKTLTNEELEAIEHNLKVSGKVCLDNYTATLIANKVLCVKNGIYFRVRQFYTIPIWVEPKEKIWRCRIVIDTLDYIEEDGRKMLRELPLQELLPTKPSRKVSAEESCTL